LKAMTTGAADIFSAIADMFGKISWSEIGDVAGDIAKSLIDGLVSLWIPMQNYNRRHRAQCGFRGERLKKTNALCAGFQSHSAFASFL
jgi:hypothetical protein